jgi:quinohemoprotein ethanol dehydrogenase
MRSFQNDSRRHTQRPATSKLTLLCALTLAVSACSKETASPTPPPTPPAQVDHERLLQADRHPGNWMAVGRTYDEQRFSPLTQINDGNVDRLGLAWYYDLGTHRGVEGTPLAIDGVIYSTSAWNITIALDGATGELLWRYDPEVDRERGAVACCDVVSRGLAAWNGKIIIATIDGRLIALDAATGKPVWSQQTFDRSWAYSITGAPRVFDGKVLIGNGGADYGARGYVTAYDAETGEQLWRFYTVPGDPKLGFESPAMEMAAKTWTGEWWKLGGGGTVWDSIVYDPELDLVYIGTGNGAPWVQAYRSPGGGDNLFLASIVALRADTGEYVWHYQQVPGEQWDYTATQPMILANLTIDGEERKVLMQAPKNGFFYVLDRVTGQLISAEKYVPNEWASHIDLKTGRPVIKPHAFYTEEPVLLTPGAAGGHNWNPMAFNPLTGLAYFPAQETWLVYSRDPAFDTSKPRQLRNTSGWGGPMTEKRRELLKIASERERGWLVAWDPVAQKERWRVEYDRPGNGGVLTTAGNLVVQGTSAGMSLAIYRADNGEKLWEMPVQNVPIAGPITYTVNGEQYIAVNAGWGGGAAMREFRAGRNMHRSDARLLAFKLDGKAELPPLPPAQPIAPPPPVTASAEQIRLGGQLYQAHCSNCHGQQAVGGGVIRDLRHMAPGTHKIFKDIVLRGAYMSMGMGNFSESLSEADADAIHAYLIKRANEDWPETQRRNERITKAQGE